MKAKAFFIIVLTFVLTIGTLSAEEAITEELSNTRKAYVNLRITTDPKVFPIGGKHSETERLREIMFGVQVQGSVGVEVFDELSLDWFRHVPDFQKPLEIGGLQTTRFKLLVSLDEKHKPAAKEFLEAYIRKLREVLEKEAEFGSGIYRRRYEQYERQLHEGRMRLLNLLNSQNNLAGNSGTLDKESVRRRIYEKEQKVIENDLQQMMLRKRAKMLVEQISQANMGNDQADAIDIELKKLQNKSEQLRREFAELERTRQTISVVLKDTQEDGLKTRLEEVMEKIKAIELTVALIDEEMNNLTTHRRQLGATAVEAIQELKHQLCEATIRLEEMEIEETVLHGYSPGSLSDSMDYEILEVQIQAARDNLHRAIVEADAFKSQMDQISMPRVHYDEIKAFETMTKDN